MIIFWALAFCGWWLCSCIDIFSKLFLRKKHIEHYLRYYHYFSWGSASLSAFLLLFLGHLGYEQPRLWCFMDNEVDNYIEYLFFYVPIGIQWLIGTILMTLVIARVINRTWKSTSSERGRARVFARLKLYQTPIAFVLIFNLMWFIFISFRLITLISEDDLEESARSWAACLLGNFFLANVSDPARNNLLNIPLIGETEPGLEGCGFVQPGRIEPRLFVLTVFTIAGNGLLLFLIFGFNSENFILWQKLIRRKCGRNGNVQSENAPSSANGSNGVSKIRNFVEEGVSTFTVLRVQTSACCARLYRLVRYQEIPERHASRHPVMRFEGATDAPLYRGTGPVQQRARLPPGGHPANQNQGQSKPRYFFSSEIAQEDVDDLNQQRHHQRHHQSYYDSDFSDGYVDPLWGI